MSKKTKKLPHFCPVCHQPVDNPHRVYCNRTHQMRAYRMRLALKRQQLGKNKS